MYMAITFIGCLWTILTRSVFRIPGCMDTMYEQYKEGEKDDKKPGNGHLKLTLGGGVIDSFAYGTRRNSASLLFSLMIVCHRSEEQG